MPPMPATPTIPHSRSLTGGVQGFALHVLAVVLALGCAPAALGQVVINMPPPKKKPTAIEVREPLQLTSVAGAPAEVRTSNGVAVVLPEPDPGRLALARYSRARTTPYNTYDTQPYYAGIRSYGYPVYWFPFFSGHHHHHHGFPFFFGSGFCF